MQERNLDAAAYASGESVLAIGPVRGPGSEVDPVRAESALIADSWRRSWDFEVGGAGVVELPFVADFDRGTPLLRAARPVLDELARDLEDARIAIVLADASAFIVERRLPHVGLETQLDASGGREGVCWGEAHAGTNALGTAIEGRHPVVVNGRDHYLDSFAEYACYGVPIFNPLQRRVEGALNLISDRGDSSPVMMALATRAARDIQRSMLEAANQSERDLVALFQRESRRTRWPLLAIDGDLTLANPAARSQLDEADVAAIRSLAETQAPPRSGGNLRLSDERVARVRLRRPRGGGFVAEVEVIPGGTDRAATAGSRLPARFPASRNPVFRHAVRLTRERLAGGGPVLLHGPPGCGKFELLVSLAPEPFEVIDCRLIAVEDGAAMINCLRAGAGRGGTVVLRHLDALDQPLLSALAAVLDEGFRDGSSRRIAATSTGPLTDPAVLAAGRFGEPIAVPALEERTEDLPLLLRELASARGGAALRLSPAASSALARWNWPGNVRELAALVDELSVPGEAREIGVENLPARLRAPHSSFALRQIDLAERNAILAALAQSDGNKVRAAEALGIARSTLYRKLRSFGIEPG